MTIDNSDLIAEIQFWQTFAQKITDKAKDVVQDVSLNTIERDVKTQMPVDTRRAAATWGHWDGSLVKPNPLAKASEAIWRVEDGGLGIEQGAALAPEEYIEKLNAGHSRQAPAGFLDAIAEKGGIVAEDKLADGIDLLAQG